ncbi:MAG: macro domain-containing protein [Elusimicrobiales bacterium]
MGRIVIKKGDITLESVDAIVNAANSYLSGGGGVDGAIHRAAGPRLYEECKKIISSIKYLEPGGAVITPAFNIKTVKYIIHTVGPIWRGGKNNEAKILENAYLNSLNIAKQNNINTISFPSISTGAYGYPVEEACKIALSVISRNIDFFDEIRMVLFSDRDFEIYKTEYERKYIKNE